MSSLRFLLILPFLSLFVSCSAPSSSESEAKHQSIAHIKLEQTDLIVEAIADHLDVPWDIELSEDGWIWFNEQKGSVSRLNLETDEIQHLLTIEDVYQERSTGLFSLVLHPNLAETPFVFVHYTYLDGIIEPDAPPPVFSRIVRYTFNGQALVDPLVILNGIPGGNGHNGSRMIISDDLKLFFAAGDTVRGWKSQDLNTLEGKMLRLNLDGSIPDDNPFPGSPVYSYGHRNPQGLTKGPDGMLFNSEHGPERNDEVNILHEKANYGWPQIVGPADSAFEETVAEKLNAVDPIATWTPTIATAGIAYFDHPSIPEWQNSLLLVTLKNQSLRVLSLSPDHTKMTQERIYLQPTLGRMRDILVAPNGDIYIATSNRDWHNRYFKRIYEDFPQADDDKIIRIQSVTSKELRQIQSSQKIPTLTAQDNVVGEPKTRERRGINAEEIYASNCAACHMPEGEGIPGAVPPLRGTSWVIDHNRTEEYISAVLFGLNEPIEVLGETYNPPMPSFADLLSDREIAAVLSYIRNSFGNEGGWVSTREVKAVREAAAQTEESD